MADGILLRVRESDLFATRCVTRLPFRFGGVTMNEAPLLTARALIETADGQRVEGFSSDLLVPKWFRKDREQSPADDAMELQRSAAAAAAALKDETLGFMSAFDLWWHGYRELVQSQREDSGDLLVRGFGLALLERAVLDAVCRATGKSFFEALVADVFAFRPGKVHPGLADWDLQKGLPEKPLQSVQVRHTVGLMDPLSVREIALEKRMEDGLPQALEEDIERYGLTLFKVKIGLGQAHDQRRLLDLARFFRSRDCDVRWTVDGNEQFQDLEQLVELFRSVAADTHGQHFLKSLLYIEQPLHRAATFEPARNAAMAELEEYAPVIIDEADTNVGSFARAVALGYRGVSVKNCKGVFRALLNRGICETSPGDLFQSAEDLTNLPVLALQQDLATIAALGLPHAERNGHHYFAGLTHLPQQEARDALAAHPDLYRENGRIVLRIENGALQLGSIQKPGFGYDVPIRVDERTPVQ